MNTWQPKSPKKRFSGILAIVYCLSILIHLVLFLWIRHIPNPEISNTSTQKPNAKVTIKVVPPNPKDQGRVLTTPQLSNKSPDKADFIADADHEAKSATRSKSGSNLAVAKTQKISPPPRPRTQDQEKPGSKEETQSNRGPSSYSDLLPSKQPSLRDLGNDEFTDSDLPDGLTFDVNTRGSRMMSYYLKLKQAIQLAIHDPSTAELEADPTTRGRDRLLGKSSVLMVIQRDGTLSTVEVVESSEHHAMDRFWTSVLRSAAPYPPLPPDFKGRELRIVYSLNYSLEMSSGNRPPRVTVF